MVNTRHIDKNSLSFDCPDYYDIGKYPSSDEAHKSIVALSKHDRKCELYIMAYRKNKFDNNAKRNSYLLKEYLKLEGYTNITENKNLHYCFNANVYNHLGNINTKIAFNFDHNDVIMIVGNVMSSSSYDCTKDIKIILETLQYNNNLFNKMMAPKNKTIIGLIAIVLNISSCILFYYYDFIFVLSGLLPGIFLLIPTEKIKSNQILLIMTLFLSVIAIILSILFLFFYICLDYPIIKAILFNYYGRFELEPFFIILITLFNMICALIFSVSTDTKKTNVSSNFCNSCGNPLNQDLTYCEECESKLKKINNYCPKCNKTYDSNEKFCRDCGTKLTKKFILNGDFNEE